MGHHGSLIGDTLKAVAVGILSAAVFLAALLVLTIPRESVDGNARSINPHAPVLTEHRDVELYDESSTGVPIFCHHYIRANTTPLQVVKILGALFFNLPLLGDMDVWTQTTTSFERQMAYLSDNGYESVDLADLVAWQRGLKELPPRSVVITFDDGDRSVLEFAYPILERYGFKATMFIVTSQVGKRWGRVDCLGWDELRTLKSTGVFSIQSHSHDLHRKVETSRGALPVFVAASEGLYRPPGRKSWTSMVREDLERSRELIGENIGEDARFLAWPYGFGSARLDSVAVAAGFHAMCDLEYGMNRRFQAIAPTDADAFRVGTANLPKPERTYQAVSLADASDSQLIRRRLDGSVVWEQFELGRHTINARTSLRGFKEMLRQRQGVAGEVRWVLCGPRSRVPTRPAR